MNEALNKDFRALDKATKEATNENALSDKLKSYLEFQRQCLYEAYLEHEEITPHPTEVKLPFRKRKIVILDADEWADYYAYSQETLNTLTYAYREIEALEEALNDKPTFSFDEFMRETVQAYDSEQFERVLERSNEYIKDILQEDNIR